VSDGVGAVGWAVDGALRLLSSEEGHGNIDEVGSYTINRMVWVRYY
jgi:hypothetical protein